MLGNAFLWSMVFLLLFYWCIVFYAWFFRSLVEGLENTILDEWQIYDPNSIVECIFIEAVTTRSYVKAETCKSKNNKLWIKLIMIFIFHLTVLLSYHCIVNKKIYFIVICSILTTLILPNLFYSLSPILTFSQLTNQFFL